MSIIQYRNAYVADVWYNSPTISHLNDNNSSSSVADVDVDVDVDVDADTEANVDCVSNLCAVSLLIARP